MKRLLQVFLLSSFLLALHITDLKAQLKDQANTHDYSHIARVAPMFYIIDFQDEPNGSIDFPISKESSETIKGKKQHWEYSAGKNAKRPTKSQIFTHYINKVKAKGGSLVFEDINDNACALKMPNPNDSSKTIYVLIGIYEDGQNYTLDVVEP